MLRAFENEIPDLVKYQVVSKLRCHLKKQVDVPIQCISQPSCDDAVKAYEATSCTERKKMIGTYPADHWVLLQKGTGLSTGPLPHLPVQAIWTTPQGPGQSSVQLSWPSKICEYLQHSYQLKEKLSLIIYPLISKDTSCSIFLLPVIKIKISNTAGQQFFTSAAVLIEFGKENLIGEISEHKKNCHDQTLSHMYTFTLGLNSCQPLFFFF